MLEWKKLGDVCDVLNGFSFKSQDYTQDGIRVIRISDVQSGYISDKDKVFYPYEKLNEFKKYVLNEGDIVMSLTGNPGRIAVIDSCSIPCALNQRVACLRAKNVIGSYLFYLFNCKEFESIALANSTGGAQKNLSTTWLNNHIIPIPSLSEQSRIISILDTFTDSIDNLKQQIEQRRKQYEHYRDQLINRSFNNWPTVTIKDVAKIMNGKDYKHLEHGNIPVYGTGGIMTYVNIYANDKPSVLLPRKGSVEKIYYVDKPFWTVDTIYWTDINTKMVFPKFLYYSLCKYDLREFSYGGGIPSLSQTILYKLEIPLPSLKEQSRIVSILDTFEQSIANLEQQLEMRQKQYEFYRNKLLTFE